MISADRASGRIPLAPLFDRTFRTEDLVASGLSIEVDRGAGHGSPRPNASSRPPGWTTELLDIDVDGVHEFRVGEWILTDGSAHLSGDFIRQVRGDLALRNAEIEWQNLHLRTGDTIGQSSANLFLRGEIGPFNPRLTKGRERIRTLTAELDFQGSASTLQPLMFFFSRAKWIEGVDGAGEVMARITFDHGVLQPDSVIDVEAHELLVDFLGFRGHGEGKVRGTIDDGDEGRDGHLGLTFDDFSLERRGTPGTFLSGSGLALHASLEDIRPEAPFQGLKVSLELPETVAPDLSLFTSSLPEALGLSFTGGAATMQARLTADDRWEEAEGTFRLSGRGLEGQLRDLDFDLDLDLSSRLTGSDWSDFDMRLDGTELRLTNGTFRHPGMEFDPDWWMTLQIPAGLVNLEPPTEAIARVALSMRDSVPLVALFADFKSWAQKFDGLLSVHDVEGEAILRLADQHLTVRELLLTGDKLEAEGELEIEQNDMAALFRARYRILPIALERKDGAQEWKLIKPLQWFQERRQEEWIDGRGLLTVPDK